MHFFCQKDFFSFNHFSSTRTVGFLFDYNFLVPFCIFLLFPCKSSKVQCLGLVRAFTGMRLKNQLQRLNFTQKHVAHMFSSSSWTLISIVVKDCSRCYFSSWTMIVVKLSPSWGDINLNMFFSIKTIHLRCC